MKRPVFTGSGTALITPMNLDGSVNYDEFERLADEQIRRGTDALVVCGTTGESATLSDEEHLQLFRCAASAACRRVPVIAGTGSNDTAHTIRLSQAAACCGVDGLLLVTPYYNKTNAEGLVRHFTAVANAVQLPVIVYNVPSRTGMSLTAETAQKLAENPWIFGIKEASGSTAQAMRIRCLCGAKLPLYAGNDTDILSVLALGGSGVISVAANLVPELVHRLCAAWQHGDSAMAQRLQFQLAPLCDALFCDVNPMPVKYAMQRIGWKAGPCRLPLYEPSAEKKESIDTVLRNFELI